MILHPLLTGLGVCGLLIAPGIAPDRITAGFLMLLASLLIAVSATAWRNEIRKDAANG